MPLRSAWFAGDIVLQNESFFVDNALAKRVDSGKKDSRRAEH